MRPSRARLLNAERRLGLARSPTASGPRQLVVEGHVAEGDEGAIARYLREHKLPQPSVVMLGDLPPCSPPRLRHYFRPGPVSDTVLFIALPPLADMRTSPARKAGTLEISAADLDDDAHPPS